MKPLPPGNSFRKTFDDEISLCIRNIREKPGDAQSLTRLAHAWINLWCFGFIPHAEAIPKAHEAVTRALNVDEHNGLAHVALGLIHEARWQWDKVESELRLGVERAPDSALAWNWYSNYLYANSRFEESYKMAEKAVSLSNDPGYKIGLGAISYFAQDFERLKLEMLEVIAAHPDYAPAFDWLGMAHIQLGEFERSIAAYEKAAALSGRLAEILGGLGHACAVAGREKSARRVLNEMLEYDRFYYVPPVQIAFIYAGLNDLENTFIFLERALAEKSWELIFIRTEPWFRHLHTHRRFQNLVSRLNFPQPAQDPYEATRKPSQA